MQKVLLRNHAAARCDYLISHAEQGRRRERRRRASPRTPASFTRRPRQKTRGRRASHAAGHHARVQPCLAGQPVGRGASAGGLSARSLMMLGCKDGKMKCDAGVPPAFVMFPMQKRCNAGVPPALIMFPMQARCLHHNGFHRCNAGVSPALITLPMQARCPHHNGFHRLFAPLSDDGAYQHPWHFVSRTP